MATDSDGIAPSLGFTTLTALLIGASLWVAEFRAPHEIGILLDDWPLYADFVWSEVRSPSRVIADLFFFSWEGRPLRAVEKLGIWAAHASFGTVGAYLLPLFVLTASGTLFAQLLRRRLPAGAAAFGGLVLALHPADTTHLWLAQLMGKIGILAMLAACSFFAKNRLVAATAALGMALGSYELSALPFVLAPYFADGGTRRSIVRGAGVFLVAVGAYAAWRLMVFPRLVPDLRSLGLSHTHGGAAALAAEALTAVPSTLRSMAFDWPLAATRLAFDPRWRTVTLAAFGSIVGPTVVLCRRKGDGRSTSSAEIARALTFAGCAVAAGCALAAWARPNIDLDPRSRHNLAALVGGSLGAAAAAAIAVRLTHRRGRIGAVLLGVAVAATLIGSRSAVRTQWTRSAHHQARVAANLIDTLGAVPPHTVVLVLHPNHGWTESDPAVMRPFATGASFEIEALLRLVYDHSIDGVCLETEEDRVRSRLSTMLPQLERDAVGFRRIVTWDARDGRAVWMKARALEEGEHRIEPNGPALEYLERMR